MGKDRVPGMGGLWGGQVQEVRAPAAEEGAGKGQSWGKADVSWQTSCGRRPVTHAHHGPETCRLIALLCSVLQGRLTEPAVSHSSQLPGVQRPGLPQPESGRPGSQGREGGVTPLIWAGFS